MTTLKSESVDIAGPTDVVILRQKVRAWSIELKFSLVDQTKMITASSELARNTLDHGGGGRCLMEMVSNGARSGLRLTFEDHGPGIPDIDLALKDGYSTGNGMGLGLSGSKRLVNEFQIASKVGEGTRICVVRWK
ncbi:MAG: anti-sigma regulatory factor [Acidobacteria bacterium]|nr:anti-sigma regulatory factor [Acidobacteriota bacterium]MBV9145522.1 anti-sigma regulatory factor [Acidobacteriota bacterium]MBV9438151.1 anti-sigma regulatory factor [Acidobacteriota bacterium]